MADVLSGGPPRGLVASLMRWGLGTDKPVLALRLGFMLLVGMGAVFAGVRLLDLPMWTFAILAVAVFLAFRIPLPGSARLAQLTVERLPGHRGGGRKTDR
ncbi:MAG: hypothetical protein HY666_03845 [Chloroflexi bacterium]|nr:hypothetical protein [Chloroflexota bacterium]